MVSSDAATVDEYLAALPEDRRAAIAAVRDVILEQLPPGYEETMQYGMIAYVVPLERYPDTYNGQPLALAALASQKRHMAVYLEAIYVDPALDAWFRERYAATRKRMDIGKSCVRFRKLDDLPLGLVGEVIGKLSVDDYIDRHAAGRAR